jgi:hypothetical protein
MLQVRYNRKRLKGGRGKEDCLLAMASLYNVLLNVCKVCGTWNHYWQPASSCASSHHTL